MQNNFVAMIIVVLYMVILLAISWYSTKYLQKKDSASFLFAKKAMSWPLVAMIVSGCAIGGSATLGVAEKAYTHGISAAWWTMAWAFAAVFYGAVLARRVNRSRYETVNQMYGAVYGDKFLTVSVIVQILNMFVVNALQVYAGGAILSSLLPEYFNLSTGIIVSAGVFMVITFIGGLWAAALSNIVNVAVIYVGILFGGIHALSSVGGVDGLTASLPSDVPWFGLNGFSLLIVVGWFVTMFVNAMPHTAVTQAAVAAKDPKNAKTGIIAAGLIMIPPGIFSAIFGIAAAKMYPELASASLALPMVATSFSPLIAGLILSGLWAADVSTATTFIMGGSSMIIKDIIIKFFKKDMSEEKQLVLSKIMIVLISVFGCLAALQIKSILDVLNTAIGFFAPFAVILIVTYLCPRFAKKSTCWWVFVPSCIIYLVSTFLVKSLAIGGQPVFTTVIVALIGLVISNIVDKRSADCDNLYKKESAEN